MGPPTSRMPTYKVIDIKDLIDSRLGAVHDELLGELLLVLEFGDLRKRGDKRERKRDRERERLKALVSFRTGVSL